MKWYAGAALLLLIALVLDLGLLAYAMYALLGVMLISRLLAGSWIAHLQAERQCDILTANVGDVVTVLVTVENSGGLPIAWVLMEDVLPAGAQLHDPPALGMLGRRIQLSTFKGRQRKTLLYQLQCNRRGYYQIGPLVLETGDVFGLHRRYRVASQPHFLLVYPTPVPLEGYEIASRRPIGEVRMTYRLFEDPTRVAGVRQYQAGDPLSRIHWRATARTAQLHSKVYEPSTVAGATILLDFHQQAHDRRHEPYRSELAITAAASVANAVYQLGQQIGLVTNGHDAADRIREEGWTHDARTRQAAMEAASAQGDSQRLWPVVVETARGADQLMRILAALARLELTDGLSLSQLVVETSSRLPRDASVIAILSQVTAETAISLGNVRRQGLAVTVLVNTYDELDFAQASGPLLAEGIETRHLRDEDAILTLCRSFVLQ